MLPFEAQFMFLDSDSDRDELIQQMTDVREQVRAIALRVPEEEWYTPRYHGWSLGAMLGHLNLSDNLGLLQIQLAMRGLNLRLSSTMWDRFNNFTTRIFQRRVVTASLQSMDNNLPRIAEFIRKLKVEVFTRDVFYPPANKNVTLEQAVQVYFLFHWRQHLETMQQTEQQLATLNGESETD